MNLDDWDRLNLACDDVLELPEQIADQLYPTVFTNPDIPKDWKTQLEEKPEAERKDTLEGLIWDDFAQKYSINARGIEWFYEDYGYGLKKFDIAPPAVIVPSTKHYSWPKAAAMLGMGHGTPLSENDLKELDNFKEKALNQGFLNVFVDKHGRMKTGLLEDVLGNCQSCRKPVVLLVTVLGSTEESAVDPLDEILEIRKSMRNKGFDFNIHADAAWGGYLLSTLRDPFDMPWPTELPTAAKKAPHSDRGMDTEIQLKGEVKRAMLSICEADSVTIDPHKWGYAPYAAGSHSYRNGKIVNLVTFGAPYIGSDTDLALGIGESGVEGSKPGAAAAGVFLSHLVIRPNKEGYGKIINQSLLNARMFYIYVAAMKQPGDLFDVVMFNELPDEYDSMPALDYIDETFLQDKPLKEILDDKSVPGPMDFVNKVGPDQTIVDYIFKKPGDGSLEELQKLNNEIFTKVYPEIGEDGTLIPAEEYPVFLSMTTFHRADYGDDFMNDLARRLDLAEPGTADAIPCMRSVVMDPWAVETKYGGKEHYNFFREIFIPQLRDIVNKCIEDE
ncbi:MAG: hypothetical protein GY850_24230 [bacterium]|nr:hypothetical protein [bacterium]